MVAFRVYELNVIRNDREYRASLFSDGMKAYITLHVDGNRIMCGKEFNILDVAARELDLMNLAKSAKFSGEVKELVLSLCLSAIKVLPQINECTKNIVNFDRLTKDSNNLLK